MPQYLFNIGILLEREVKCTYMLVLGHKHMQGHQFPHHQHLLICSVFLSDRNFLVALALSGSAALFKAKSPKVF